MTATDVICVPTYQIAALAMMNLARSWFRIAFEFEGDPVDGATLHWIAMRKLAEKILERRALELNAAEIDALRGVLSAHSPCSDKEFLGALSFNQRG